MTKEIKLSLIFGFALVLVVGVLLSDHLSGARQATLDGVNPTAGVPAPVAAAPADPNAVPPLVLVGEDGTPQPRQPQPNTTQNASFAEGGKQVHAIPAVNYEPEPETSLAERIRQRMSAEFTSSVTDLQNGEAPQPAVALDVTPMSPVESDAAASEPGLTRDAELANQPTDPVVQDETRKVGSDSFRLYTVKEGDTLWSISSRLLGDGRRHKELADLNRDRMSADGQLRAGASIKIPTGSAKAPRAEARPEQAKSKARPADDKKTQTNSKVRKYEVKSGDTLSRIAARLLGSASRTDDLLAANTDILKDEDSLEVGMTLDIPAR